MIIHSCQIDGVVCDLRTTGHFIQRAYEANISLGLIAKLLRKGGFDIYKSINNRIRILVQNIELVIDMTSCSLITIILTNSERQFMRSPTIGDGMKKRVA